MILIKILLLFVSLFFLYLIYKKFKLNRQNWNIFVFTTLFWISIKLIRSFRSSYTKELFENKNLTIMSFNLGIGVVAVAGIYGLVSVFARLPFGIIYGKSKNKFTLIRFVTLFLFITSLLVGFGSTKNENYLFYIWLSALAMGVGASVWGLLNVSLNNDMKKTSIAAISTLSLSPLIAEYIAGPLQLIAKSNKEFGLVFLWKMSALFALITFIYSFFIKIKNLQPDFKINQEKSYSMIRNWNFWLISLLGTIVILIKFSTTGNVATLYLTNLSNDPFLVSYIDVVFSLAQLMSSVYLGLFIYDKFGFKNSLSIGLLAIGMFSIINSLVQNSWVFFITFALNGIGYGICYNLLMAKIIDKVPRISQAKTMGLYQTALASGIYFGSIWGVKGIINNNFSNFLKTISIFIVILIIIVQLPWNKLMGDKKINKNDL